MGYNAGRGIGDGLVDVNGGAALLQQRTDKLVRQMGMRAAMPAAVPQRPRQELVEVGHIHVLDVDALADGVGLAGRGRHEEGEIAAEPGGALYLRMAQVPADG